MHHVSAQGVDQRMINVQLLLLGNHLWNLSSVSCPVVCVCVCACVCVHVCVCACARASLFGCSILCFVMGYVLQFGEIAHKRVHYYYDVVNITFLSVHSLPFILSILSMRLTKLSLVDVLSVGCTSLSASSSFFVFFFFFFFFLVRLLV